MDIIGRVQKNQMNDQVIQQNALRLKQDQRAEAGMQSLEGKGMENITPDDLMQAGKHKEAIDLYNTRKSEIVTRMQTYGKILSAVKDQAGWDKVREFAQRIYPDMANEIPPTFDPAVRDSFIALTQKAVDSLPTYKIGNVEQGDQMLNGYWAEEPGQPPKFVTTHTAPRYKPGTSGDNASLNYRMQRDQQEDKRKLSDEDQKILAAREMLAEMNPTEIKAAIKMGNAEIVKNSTLAKRKLSTEGGSRGSKGYQEYMDAYNRAKGNPDLQRKITERARKLGVVK